VFDEDHLILGEHDREGARLRLSSEDCPGAGCGPARFDGVPHDGQRLRADDLGPDDLAPYWAISVRRLRCGRESSPRARGRLRSFILPNVKSGSDGRERCN
jgi:hypothetical protein